MSPTGDALHNHHRVVVQSSLSCLRPFVEDTDAPHVCVGDMDSSPLTLASGMSQSSRQRTGTQKLVSAECVGIWKAGEEEKEEDEEEEED